MNSPDTFDPYRAFPDFYTNPTIAELAERARWTVSDNQKVPMNARAMLDGTGLYGAKFADQRCLVTLTELTAKLPTASNCALRVETDLDDLVVLDIEKTCPIEVRNHLLTLPGVLYSEVSRSGRGYHLVLPKPELYDHHELARSKTVLRHEQGWYEVLQSHYVTLTRTPIPTEVWQAAREHAQQHGTADFETVYSELAAAARPSASQVTQVELEEPSIPLRNKAISYITALPVRSTLEDFGGDTSRWETSHLGTFYNRLDELLGTTPFRATCHQYSDSDRAWIIYRAAEKTLPWRPKHDEQRGGMPLLLSAAQYVVSQRRSQKDQQEQQETTPSADRAGTTSPPRQSR